MAESPADAAAVYRKQKELPEDWEELYAVHEELWLPEEYGALLRDMDEAYRLFVTDHYKDAYLLSDTILKTLESMIGEE